MKSNEEIVNLFCEIQYVCNKKNHAVRWLDFEYAASLRKREREVYAELQPVFKEWLDKNHPEEPEPIDPKDEEIERLRGIIEKLHNEKQENSPWQFNRPSTI